MSGNTLFSHSIRVLACSNCGAPLTAAADGGRFTCEYCGATNQVGRRDDELDLQRAQAAASSSLSESERFQRLRAQDGKPLRPPPALQHLIADDQLAANRVDQAINEWQSARQELAASQAPYPPVTITSVPPPGMADRLGPGSTLPVKLDPADPQRSVEVEWDSF